MPLLILLPIFLLVIPADARSPFLASRNVVPRRILGEQITLRGGENVGDKTESDSELAAAVGILDLRPDSSSCLPVFGRRSSLGGVDAPPCDSVVTPTSLGEFPASAIPPADGGDSDAVPTATDEEEAQERTFDSQSAAAESIGTLCGSVCLLLAYDPAEGKTILHRTAGLKLAAVINGIRRRAVEGKGKTRLALLLFRSGEGDSCNGTSWDESGAEFLVERLRTFFAMGGSESGEDGATGTDDPFESVDVVRISSSLESEAASQIKSIFESGGVYSSAQGEDEEAAFRSLIQSTYESMGGVGHISFPAGDNNLHA